MLNNEFMAERVEEPQNYEQKTLCCLVVDTSGSMSGAPIAELNRGLLTFYNDIKGDNAIARRLEIAVVTFNSSVDVPVAPALVDSFSMPQLGATGTTKLVDGVRHGIKMVTDRKDWYRTTGQPHLRPWIIMITDGVPDGDQDVSGLAQEIARGVANKSFAFFALGVKGADMNMLQSISSADMQPAMLDGVRFVEFFRWLSNSMGKVSQSRAGDKVAFAVPTWMSGVIA